MLGLAALLQAGPACADPAGRMQALALSELFVRTCFSHPGNVAALRNVLVGPGFAPLGRTASAALLPRPGRVYQATGPSHLMVLSFDDGWCGNGGTGIDPAGLTVALSDAMRASGTHMKLMDANRDGREQHYLLERPAMPPMALLVMMQPAGSSMQASLFAAPIPEAPAR